MEEIIKHIIENELEDLRGLRISGKVPMDPDFLNEIIAGVLKSETGESGSSATKSSSSAPSLPEADYRALLGEHIRKLELSVEGEKIVLHFDIRIP